MNPETKQLREYKKCLVSLTGSVAQALSLIDAAMRWPSTVERGERIAMICNALDMANDSAMHFGLGYGWKKIQNIKKGGDRKNELV